MGSGGIQTDRPSRLIRLTHDPPTHTNGLHAQVVVYGYARERAATTRLPWPFVPLRDGLILPCFRAVEASAQWLLSDRPVSQSVFLSGRGASTSDTMCSSGGSGHVSD